MTTTYFLNLASGNLFGTEIDPPIPVDYYIGLSRTTPNLDGTNVDEPPAQAAYSRVHLTELSKPDNGVVTNTADINFNESTASWDTVTHYVIYDSPTTGDGNLLMYGELSTHRSVEMNTIMTIKQGLLKLSVKNPTV